MRLRVDADADHADAVEGSFAPDVLLIAFVAKGLFTDPWRKRRVGRRP